MPDYASAVRQATLAAARLHRDLGSEAVLTRAGGNVDVFAVLAKLGVPMLLRPLSGLLGAFLRDPMPGILITTERPLSVQRFTAAHELGHFRMKHQPSLDDETILRRSPFGLRPGYDVQEVEADAFAVRLYDPAVAHCRALQTAALVGSRPQTSGCCLSAFASVGSQLRGHMLDARAIQASSAGHCASTCGDPAAPIEADFPERLSAGELPR